MSSHEDLLTLALGACLSLPLALTARAIAIVEPLPPTSGGSCGHQRELAMASPLFRSADPILRRAGALVRIVVKRGSRGQSVLARPLTQLLEFQRKQLVWAGEPWGLERHEAIALSLVFALLGAGVGALLGSTQAWIVPGALIGGATLNLRLHSLRAARFLEVSRELPSTIDLIALSMNAGSDFPGAVRRVIKGQSGVVVDELGHLLRALDLGITRQGALVAMRERVPVQEVRDLVRAMLLAEKKGSSVREALSHQARASRQRRSVRAEEAAARAGILLLVPLMFLMGCIMILLIGPLMTSGVSL